MLAHCITYSIPRSFVFPINWQLDLESRLDLGLIFKQEDFIGSNMYSHTLHQGVSEISSHQ